MTKYKYLIGAAILFSTVLLGGCKNDLLDADVLSGEDPSNADGEELYMAIRIYNAGSVDAGSRSRAMDPTFDSNGSDYEGSAGGNFNTGRANENAIYPSGTKTDCPNYLLLFGQTGGSLADRLEYLLPLFDWDYAENGKPKTETDNEKYPNNSGYTDYNTFYTSANRYELPESFDNRKVLIVLNASTLLQNKLKAALKANDTYESIMNLKIGDPGIIDENFLYYVSPDNTRYFTMSSSIVIPGKDLSDKALTKTGEKGPSVVKWDYSWRKDRTTAAQNPVFSFFVERLQSKFTLTIKDPRVDKYYYFTTDPNAVETDKYIPLINCPMVISSKSIEEAQTIQYIKQYRRRRNGNPEDKDYVKQFIATAGEWKINLMGWNVNGVHRQEYLFKQIDDNRGYYSSWNVIDYSPYRNFWAESPLYEQRTFPDQYRKAKILTYENKEIDGVSTPSKALKDASLVYDGNVKAWDDVKNRRDIMTYYNFNSLNEFSPHQYSAENTYDPTKLWPNEIKMREAWDGRAYMRAGNHIVLTAQLLIQGLDPEDVFIADKFNPSSHLIVGNTTGGTTKQAESKYYMNGIYWSADAYREYVGEYIGYWMQEDEETFGHNDGVFYVLNFDNNTHEPIIPSDLSNLVPAENMNFFIEPLGVEGGDGWAHVIPNLASLRNDLDVQNMSDTEKEETVVFFAYDPDNTKDDGSPIFTPITMKTFELLAHAHPEYYARHFNAGRMYYSIPVTHYDDEPGYLNFKTGRYGAVRNHWYNFTIKSIRNIGTSVSDPSADLIIPNTDHSYDALGLTLSVLPWHWVEEDVDITSQRQPANPDEIDLDLYIKADDWNYEGSDYTEGF